MKNTNDCYSNGKRKLIVLEQAMNILRDSITPLPINDSTCENVSIFQACNRISTYDIIAKNNIPAYDNSAVDGYAYTHLDATDSNTTKEYKIRPLVGRVPAGSILSDFPSDGCVRIFTGAPVPNTFDTVAMQEDTLRNERGETNGIEISLPMGLKPGANIRRKGEDVQQGQCIVPHGKTLSPADIGLISSQGFDTVNVRRRLRVGFFSSGNELLQAGKDNTEKLKQGFVFDSNRPMMQALLSQLGIEMVDLGCIADTAQAVKDVFEKGTLSCDMIFSAGGMSVGEEDHIQKFLTQSCEVKFWGVKVKPGKPVGFGLVHGIPFMGLPGNPVSVQVMFGLLGVPALRLLSGKENHTHERIQVPLGFDIKTKLGRREFMRCQLVDDGQGKTHAIKSGQQGSGIISSLAMASGLIEIHEDSQDVKKGDYVSYIPLDTMSKL